MSVDKKEIIKNVKKASEGVLSKIVDLTLVSVFYGLEASISKRTRVGEVSEKVSEDLSKINFNSIKNSIKYLKRKGFIQALKEKALLPVITEEGKRRLNSILPQYDDKRTWDARVYVVTYDLPRAKNSKRNMLRDYLKKIGCGSLQYSVWITSYNPKKLIEEFVEYNKLENDLILISSLGKDGTIGDMDLKDLMEEVYNLSELNLKYAEFINDVKNKSIVSKGQIVFSFLSILKDDPQIPFDLLPDDWKGNSAYKIFKELTKG